jgi:5-methylcytosine-specific restriction protein B
MDYSNQIDTSQINIALEQYLADFNSHWTDEKYKWEAVQCFQQNWDINSPNFAEMLERALSKTGNLLSSMNTFPRGMMLNFAKAEPEGVRNMFKTLFNEDIDLVNRFDSFVAEAERIRKQYDDGTWYNHYQNTNAVSTFLWLKFPDKYYIYKYGEYNTVGKKISNGVRFARNGSPEEMIKGMSFYGAITSVIAQNQDFVNLFHGKLAANEALYKDPYLHTATVDFCFWVSRYFNEAPSIVSEPLVAMQPKPRYWLYAPGDNASMWDECRDHQFMCIGWEALEDLTAYATKKDITEAVQKAYDKGDSSCKNDTLALWQFVHEMKPGDIVYAKKGVNQIIGRGIVTGDYEYDAEIALPNIRKVNWTHFGVWPHPGQAVLKTLTDITKYHEYVEKLENMIVHNVSQPSADNATDKRYWWLVANPKIWSMAELPVGDRVEYSLYNDNGKQRRIFQNLVDAKVGDLVIGYESTPRKQIVAFAEVSRASDGESIEFTKTESLIAPIDYASIKGVEDLANMQFFGNAQGSFFALTEDEYDCLYDIIRESNPKQENVDTSTYTKEDFLSEVYLSSAEYDKLVKLLSAKKNIILQGAPGVGKTFAAKRLAYSIIGAKDASCIEMVQFHQNYTYEDFIMGYKPNEDGGFRIEKGKFYNFCNKAIACPEKKFFFIIDEINRGNLSKIFGELLMLIENNYRGNKHKISLAYSHEDFYVPENLYIIGMMSTADRSLAMIDYALRRRFSFYDMNPAFDSDGFKTYQSLLHSETFDKFIESIKRLNEDIAKDDSLGSGFTIGHSYFCNQIVFDKQWLENVLEFDIAPMLKEYWFDDIQKYEAQVAQLRNILK